MNRSEWIITVILRVMGAGGMLAIPAIFFPYSWMNAIHGYLGLGELPDAPIVSYLARSLSVFYAMMGAISLFISLDVRGNRSFVKLWGFATGVVGLVLLGIDINAGMPASWTVGEGPMVASAGMIVLWLQRDIASTGSD